ncbi:MAG: hypothetical protein ABEH66_00065 [Halobacteriales archaeon]
MSSRRGILDRTDALLGPYAGWSARVLRWGLGVSFLIGGGYKILAPSVYQAYFAPLFASLWPTAIVPLAPVFVLAGTFEFAFGVLLLADWHTPTVAGLTVPWLFGTNTNFVVAVAQGESSVDLLALYVGLMMMALGVALQAVEERST